MLSATGTPSGDHTDVGVQRGLVEILDDGLDGLNGPVPVVQRGRSDQRAHCEAMRGFLAMAGLTS